VRASLLKTLTPFDSLVQVELVSGSKRHLVRDAVVDTGASITAIGMDVAKKMGLKLVRKGYGFGVGGRVSKYMAVIDKMTIMPMGGRSLCSIGPIKVHVISFGFPNQMLIGMDVLMRIKAMLKVSKGRFILSCKTPKELIHGLAVGRALGAW
jgi:predicted aspartyl protease